MVAQHSSDAAAVLGLLVLLAVVGLQIYLIYAIIATRQDVRVIRRLLGGDQQPTPQPPPPPGHSPGRPMTGAPGTSPGAQHQIDYYSQDGEFYCRTCGFTTIDSAEAQQHRLWGATTSELGAAMHQPGEAPFSVVLQAIGDRQEAVERVLMDRAGYARAGARRAARGEQVLSTTNYWEAQQVQAAIQEAGGIAEIQGAKGAPAASDTASSQEVKTCPDCAEQVRALARKCRFCGYVFEGEETGPAKV